MEFWKMNGAGNDFIVVDDRRNAVPDHRWPELARTLCQRHLSIGADGLMVVKPPACGGDYRMLFFNSDGSMGEMCGNGARCNIRLDGRAEVDGRTYDYTYLELGDPGIPHAAVPMAGLRGCDQAALFHLGRQLRYYKDFPKGANVNFYELIGPDHVYERTYERGVEDFTYACGTGTGSVVTVLTLLGKVSGKNVQVDMTGGRLVIDVERDAAGRVADLYLTGPTNIVCKGRVTDETLPPDSDT